MAFIRCADCEWEQDDFWSQDPEFPYNPINSLKHWEEKLFEDGVTPKDYWDPDTIEWAIRDFARFDFDISKQFDEDGNFFLTWQQYAAWETMKATHRILNMLYRTETELKKKGFQCPRCGGAHYIDD